jgi:hypothetical protein
MGLPIATFYGLTHTLPIGEPTTRRDEMNQQVTTGNRAVGKRGPRGYITKSKAGHYTATVRDAQGVLLHIQDRLPSLQAAREENRAAIAKATSA